jgi:hypothetical protein
MTYNEILETGNNPIIEIPRSADKNIYVLMYSGVQAGTITIPIDFIEIINYVESLWDRARRLTRPIKIHEDDLQDANPVR